MTMKSAQGTEMKGEGKIKDKDVSWSVVVNGPMGEIVLAFKGKVDGEAMAGTVTMGDAGEADFKAKRTSKLAERTQLYERAQEVFKREAPWVPMAHSVIYQPMRQNVEGFKMSPFATVQFFGVSLK